MTVRQLQSRAKELGLRGFWRLRKADLEDLVECYSTTEVAAPGISDMRAMVLARLVRTRFNSDVERAAARGARGEVYDRAAARRWRIAVGKCKDKHEDRHGRDAGWFAWDKYQQQCQGGNP